MAESSSGQIPQEFLNALDEMRQAIDNNTESRASGDKARSYADNMLNPPDDIKKSTTVFDAKYVDSYQKYGEAFMVGAAKQFFIAQADYEKKKDYSSAKKEEKKPVVNLHVEKSDIVPPKEEGPAPEWMDELALTIGSALLILGIQAGTTALGQTIESIALLPKLLKTKLGSLSKMNLTKWANTLVEGAKKAGGIILHINRLFPWLEEVASKATAGIIKMSATVSKIMPNNMFGKTVAGAVKLSANITKFLGLLAHGMGRLVSAITAGMQSAGAVTKVMTGGVANLFGKLGAAAAKIAGPLLSKLKFLPFIGSALGFYQAYLRFEEGEYVKGTLELASAIAGLLPGPGIWISLGINALVSLMDAGMSTGGGLIGGIASMASKGKGLFKLLPKAAMTLFKPLGMVLKKLPLIGTIISFAMAFDDFEKGDILKGILNLASGVASLFPGIGSLIAIGLDVINMFIDGSDAKEPETPEGTTDKGFFTKIWDWIKDACAVVWDAIKKIPEWIMAGLKWLVEYSPAGLAFKFGQWVVGLFSKKPKTEKKVTFIDAIKKSISFVWNTITNIPNYIKKIFTWVKEKTPLKYTLKTLEWIFGLFKNDPKADNSTSIVDSVKNLVKDIWDWVMAIPNAIKGMWDSLWNTLGDTWDWITELCGNVRDAFSAIPKKLGEMFDWFVNKLKWIYAPIRNVLAYFGITSEDDESMNIIAKAGELIGNVIDGIRSGLMAIRDKLVDMVVWALDKVKSVVSGVGWILEKVGIDSVSGWADALDSTIKSLKKGSPPGGKTDMGSSKGGDQSGGSSVIPNPGQILRDARAKAEKEQAAVNKPTEDAIVAARRDQTKSTNSLLTATRAASASQNRQLDRLIAAVEGVRGAVEANPNGGNNTTIISNTTNNGSSTGFARMADPRMAYA